jgi:hypothetical protein
MEYILKFQSCFQNMLKMIEKDQIAPGNLLLLKIILELLLVSVISGIVGGVLGSLLMYLIVRPKGRQANNIEPIQHKEENKSKKSQNKPTNDFSANESTQKIEKNEKIADNVNHKKQSDYSTIDKKENKTINMNVNPNRNEEKTSEDLKKDSIPAAIQKNPEDEWVVAKKGKNKPK